MVELNYEWVIKELAFLPQQNGESFYSPIFTAKANPNIRWRLKICPKGINEGSKDYLSLYLERVVVNNESSLTVKSKWLVKKNSREILSKPEEVQTLGPAPLLNSFGWDKFVLLSSIKRAPINQEMETDKIKISCQLVYTI